MSLSARLGKLVGLFAPGTRLAHGERMYAAARPTEDAAGWLPLDRNVNDVVRASSPVVRARVRQLEDELHEYKMQKKITALAPRDGSVNPEQVMRKLLGTGGDL